MHYVCMHVCVSAMAFLLQMNNEFSFQNYIPLAYIYSNDAAHLKYLLDRMLHVIHIYMFFNLIISCRYICVMCFLAKEVQLVKQQKCISL